MSQKISPYTAVVLSLLFFSASLPEKPDFTETALSDAGLRAIDSLYVVLETGAATLPTRNVFSKAMVGHKNLVGESHATPGKIAIIDFTLPSTEKRLWVIDLEKGEVVHHSLVAHGKNSGEIYATKFSNEHDSNQSSLGFFVTGQTYIGKHGLSLKLHGMERGINDRAESRAIVMHGADYVSEEYVRKVGRLGRSWGCPAIPNEGYKEVIKVLSGGTVLFIHSMDPEYLAKSQLAGS
jgi:hypothetical protein